MSDVTQQSLTTIAAHIAAGEISATEVTEQCLRRIDRDADALNCFISLDAAGAMRQAEAADEKVASGAPLGLLHGVPLAHKDMFYRAGVVVTCGSKIRKDFRPAVTATVLQRLEAAGALHLGGLNMAEFAFGPTGHNAHYGAARNPWRTDTITGGSSSGSGSATAARLVYGALGSDTGGSVRLPAAACGLVGIKPTQGRVSRHGAMGLSFSLDNIGPLTRTVRDCARLLAVIAGEDPNDPTASRHAVSGYEAAALTPDIKGLRIGVPANYYYDTVEDVVREALEASLDVLRDLGAEVVSVTVPDHDHLTALAQAVQGSESATLHGAWMRERPNDYGPQVRARIETGFDYSATDYLGAVQVRPAVIERFVGEVFSRCDVLHLPSIPVRLPTIDATDVGDDEGYAELLGSLSRCTRPLNYLALPALAVPAGFIASEPGGGADLPVSFQLAGRPFDEARLFRAGAAYEGATRWHERAPAASVVA